MLLDLLATHGPALRRIAWAYGGATGEEEDLHQEILLQLWRGLPSFRGDAAPGTWLYRVALNTALTWRRRTQREATRDDERHAPRPGAAGTAAAMRLLLEEFLASLGGVDRSVLLLYMEGLGYQEIAGVTGMSANAIGIRLHRIKQRFTREYLEE